MGVWILEAALEILAVTLGILEAFRKLDQRSFLLSHLSEEVLNAAVWTRPAEYCRNRARSSTGGNWNNSVEVAPTENLVHTFGTIPSHSEWLFDPMLCPLRALSRNTCTERYFVCMDVRGKVVFWSFFMVTWIHMQIRAFVIHSVLLVVLQFKSLPNSTSGTSHQSKCEMALGEDKSVSSKDGEERQDLLKRKK